MSLAVHSEFPFGIFWWLQCIKPSHLVYRNNCELALTYQVGLRGNLVMTSCM